MAPVFWRWKRNDTPACRPDEWVGKGVEVHTSRRCEVGRRRASGGSRTMMPRRFGDAKRVEGFERAWSAGCVQSVVLGSKERMLASRHPHSTAGSQATAPIGGNQAFRSPQTLFVNTQISAQGKRTAKCQGSCTGRLSRPPFPLPRAPDPLGAQEPSE